MRFLLKFLFLVVVLAGVGLVGFAYLGDLSPSVTTVTEPVVLDVD